MWLSKKRYLPSKMHCLTKSDLMGSYGVIGGRDKLLLWDIARYSGSYGVIGGEVKMRANLYRRGSCGVISG